MKRARRPAGADSARSDIRLGRSESHDFIKLDQFLKWQGLADTGGRAKQLIQDGQVRVNGQVETRRGRKLVDGDRVTIGGQTITVKLSETV